MDLVQVDIDISDVAAEFYDDDRVGIYAPATRNDAGQITSTAMRTVPLVDGKATVDLKPGAVVVRLMCRGVADTTEKPGWVPEQGPVSLADVILKWTPALIDQGILAILAAVDGALGQVAGAVEGNLSSFRAGLVPQAVRNLWDYDASTAQSMNVLGTPQEHARHRLSPFIPVEPGEYVSRHGLHRVLFFTADYVLVQGTDTGWLNGEQHWAVPASAAFARMVIDPGDLDRRDAVFNRGAILFDPDAPDRPVPSGWWDDRELPPAEVSVQDVEMLHAADVPASRVLVNLWDYDASTAQSMNVLGTPQDHARHRLSPFIPVEPGEYVSKHSLHRILFFTPDYVLVQGTDTGWLNGEQHWAVPASAAFARMVIDPGDLDRRDAVFNRGAILFDPDDPDRQVPSGWWDDRELPPADEVKLEELRHSILAEISDRPNIPHFEPSFPTLAFDPDWYVGWARPRWLSQDGLMLWGSRGFILEQSDDEWKTRQIIHEFPRGIEAVRETSDGELLVSIIRDEATDQRSVLFRSSGYSRDDPTAATWDPVLSTVSKQADFKSTWGLGVSGNVVTASEYGLRGVEGSRRGWLSEDHGATWKMVFDQKTVIADGQPEWVDGRAHLHGITWDPYWNRLWALCGDNPSTALYYSDDKGDSWKFVPGSDRMQYTGCMPLPDTVLFGSDRTPNGLHVYRRGLLTDIPVVEPLLVVDDSLSTTKAFGLPFRRDQSPASATYFPGPDAGYATPSVITATVDGRKGHLLWAGQTPGSGLSLSGTIAEVLGPTAQGGIVATMAGDPTVTGIRVMRAVAPTWQRA